MGGTTAAVVADAIKLAGQRRRVTIGQMQAASGYSSSDWARRMKDGDWRLSKLESLARFLRLSVPDFLAGPTYVSSLIDREGGESLPHLDSNQEPSAYQSTPVAA